MKIGTYKILSKHPHSRQSFTQGLFFSNDGSKLYESIGLYARSRMQILNPVTQQIVAAIALPSTQFAEGATLHQGQIYQLTYREGCIYVRDPITLRAIALITNYPRQGWGLTSNGSQLIATDGTSNLYYLNATATSVTTAKVVRVTINGRPLTQLNELEWMPKGTLHSTQDLILVNEWNSFRIHAVNPVTGIVQTTWTITGIYTPTNINDTMNGIARRSGDPMGVVWITGKRWPVIVRVQLVL